MTPRVEWVARRSTPPLVPGRLHCWKVSLDGLLGQRESLLPLLAGDERDRAARFHFDRDAARYVIARAVLRRLLASYLGTPDAAGVALRYGPHGKPALADGASGDALVQFNLAHTGGFALYAFARAQDIGVDVERVHELPDMQAVMRSHFAANERRAIGSLPEAQHAAAFFRCWTRKEAVLKALGWGLARPLESFEVSVAVEDPRLLHDAGDVAEAGQWCLRHLDPAPGYVGAVAWRGPALGTEHYEFAA